jgi:GDP-mannose 6-dehydrogenase
VLGLTFKENTDDLRESPVIALLEYLIGKGRDVRIHDPNVSLAWTASTA